MYCDLNMNHIKSWCILEQLVVGKRRLHLIVTLGTFFSEWQQGHDITAMENETLTHCLVLW